MSTHQHAPTLEQQAEAFATALNDYAVLEFCGDPDWEYAQRAAALDGDLIQGIGTGYVIGGRYLVAHRLDGPFGKPGYTVESVDSETVERFADALETELADEDTADDCVRGDWQGALDNACTVSGMPLELVLEYSPGHPWAGFVVAGQAIVHGEDGQLLEWLSEDQMQYWLEWRHDHC